MTHQRAIDRLLNELGWPESYRAHLERIVSGLTDNAATMDKDTYDEVKQYILNLR